MPCILRLTPFLSFPDVLRHPTTADVPAAGTVSVARISGLAAGNTGPLVYRFRFQSVAIQFSLKTRVVSPIHCFPFLLHLSHDYIHDFKIHVDLAVRVACAVAYTLSAHGLRRSLGFLTTIWFIFIYLVKSITLFLLIALAPIGSCVTALAVVNGFCLAIT